MKNNLTLRHLRETAHLSQVELAELLDVSQGRVSRYESGDEHPPLAVALACYAVFGRPPHRMFIELYGTVEEGVMARGAEFERSIRDKHDRVSRAKRAALERMMSRACSHDRA